MAKKRKQVERELSLQERQYQTLVENSPDFVVRYNTELKRIYVNPAWEEASGLSADEVVNKHASQIPKVPQPVQEEYYSALQDALENGNRHAVDFTWVNARGKTLHLQYVVVPETDQDGNVISVLAVGRDVTAYLEAVEALSNREEHLRRVNRALRTLSAGNETLVRAVDEQELLERMCRVIVEVGGHALALIGRVGWDNKITEPLTWAGSSDFELHENCTSGACHHLHEAIEHASPIVINDLLSDPHCSDCYARFPEFNIRSGVILPLQSEGDCLGVLSIFSTDLASFDEDEVELLVELADDLAYGIRALRNRVDRMEGLRRIQKIMEDTIQALASTIEVRDPYTSGHQRRVARLAVEIGHELGLDDDRIRGLYLASSVHDIGKIGVPSEILTKPRQLSQIEFNIVMTHVTAGYDILKSIDFPWPIAQTVYQHHERMDGSGYPNGVSGEDLLLESRILAVADVVEAIASFRPYRPAFSIDTALEEIEAGRDSLFDGSVVDACVHLFREKKFELE